MIDYLLQWYLTQCDGDWEHRYGIDIHTLDNPGWALKIDLIATPLQGKALERTIVDRDPNDWVQLWSDGATFEAACGPQNLPEAVEGFKRFVGSIRDTSSG